ncbi:hypothetical protein OO006_04825 [Prosthecochloris sp. SCSIO W1101]|uniref:hypothetical protein n=1 Tax=Prosthecochloris sp. SCSIO W1101 TaxID=2992242 RepID=UPI00223D0EB6|nr:hypothetical protein [Prosthecochloris sp. SCSIO W1101]UZJ42295.1 hypothetical protein OO006_04825 [Prosthecochloris sp. SCSIO W1101]
MTYLKSLYERRGNVSPDFFDIVRPFIQAIDSGQIQHHWKYRYRRNGAYLSRSTPPFRTCCLKTL